MRVVFFLAQTLNRIDDGSHFLGQSGAQLGKTAEASSAGESIDAGGRTSRSLGDFDDA